MKNADKSFGWFYFGQPITDAIQYHNVREYTQNEYKAARSSGFAILPGEKYYTGEHIEFLTPGWEPLLVARDGKIFNITLQRVGSKHVINLTHETVVDWFTKALGKSTSQSGKKYIWDLPNSRILVNQKSILFGMGGYAVNLVATCFDLSKIPPITEWDYE